MLMKRINNHAEKVEERRNNSCSSILRILPRLKTF
jgi:hypothetical protein